MNPVFIIRSSRYPGVGYAWIENSAFPEVSEWRLSPQFATQFDSEADACITAGLLPISTGPVEVVRIWL